MSLVATSTAVSALVAVKVLVAGWAYAHALRTRRPHGRSAPATLEIGDHLRDGGWVVTSQEADDAEFAAERGDLTTRGPRDLCGVRGGSGMVAFGSLRDELVVRDQRPECGGF